MRLELNLPALERLIGGDTEIEAALRQQVVEAFLKRHIKAILNNEVIKKVSQEFQHQVKLAVAEKIAECRKSYEVPNAESLQWDFRKVVQEAVEKEIASVIAAQKKYFEPIMRQKVASALEIEIEQEVHKRVIERLKGR